MQLTSEYLNPQEDAGTIRGNPSVNPIDCEVDLHWYASEGSHVLPSEVAAGPEYDVAIAGVGCRSHCHGAAVMRFCSVDTSTSPTRCEQLIAKLSAWLIPWSCSSSYAECLTRTVGFVYRVYQYRLRIKRCSVHWRQQHHMGARHRLHIHRPKLRSCDIGHKNSSEFEILPGGQKQGLLRVACNSKQHLYGSRLFLLRRLSWHWCSAHFRPWDRGTVSWPNLFYRLRRE